MKKYEIMTLLTSYRAMAIVRPKDFQEADKVAKACVEAKIPVLEISLNAKHALEIIKKLKEKYGNQIICGAGTVLDATSARLAILAGSDFIIAPNFDKEVALLCNLYDVAYGPGVSSMTEVSEAMKYGASFIKAFPISNFYGKDLVKVIKTPLPQVILMASGGVQLNNLEQWLKSGVDICAFGNLLTTGDYETILANAKEVKRIIQTTV